MRRQSWLWNGWVPVLLFVIALVPRVAAFSPLSNPDEVTWLERSVAFYDALDRGDWAATIQSRHPGVVPMWGFGALLCVRYGLAQLRAWQAADARPMAELARTALFFPVLVSVLTTLAVYGLLRRLAGREAALYAALLVTLEPYYLAYTHTIHLDAVVTSLMLVAALLWLNYLHGSRRWPYLVGSSIVAGLAFLTRSMALYLIPFSLLATGAYFLADNLAGPGLRLRPGWGVWLRRTTLAWLLWLGLLALTVWILWPALWVTPAAVFEGLVSGTAEGLASAHPGQVFFQGQIINQDPGVLFYGMVLLFRLRPLTLVLACLNPILFAWSWRQLSAQQRAAWSLGLGYVLFYAVQMSLAADKLERYLLPIVPVLALLAGVSLAIVVRWLVSLITRWRGRPVPAMLPRAIVIVGIVLLAMPWLRLAPYFGAYFNPLVGGGPRAAQLFTVGSGGAPDRVAAYLNAKPGAEDLWALSFYPNVFRYYFKGHTQSPGWGSWGGLPVAAHYVVVTLGQKQRGIYATTLDFFLPRQPEYTVHINDLDYAWVYRVPRQELSTPPAIQRPLDANFEHRVHLIGYDLNQVKHDLQLTLYWQLIVSMHDKMWVTLRLQNGSGQVIVEQDDPPWPGEATVLSWPDGLAVRAEHVLHLPPDLPAGDYSLVVSLREQDEQGKERLLTLEGDEGTEVILKPIDVGSP